MIEMESSKVLLEIRPSELKSFIDTALYTDPSASPYVYNIDT
jgi:hypothetical protein